MSWCLFFFSLKTDIFTLAYCMHACKAKQSKTHKKSFYFFKKQELSKSLYIILNFLVNSHYKKIIYISISMIFTCLYTQDVTFFYVAFIYNFSLLIIIYTIKYSDMYYKKPFLFNILIIVSLTMQVLSVITYIFILIKISLIKIVDYIVKMYNGWTPINRPGNSYNSGSSGGGPNNGGPGNFGGPSALINNSPRRRRRKKPSEYINRGSKKSSQDNLDASHQDSVNINDNSLSFDKNLNDSSEGLEALRSQGNTANFKRVSINDITDSNIVVSNNNNNNFNRFSIDDIIEPNTVSNNNNNNNNFNRFSIDDITEPNTVPNNNDSLLRASIHRKFLELENSINNTSVNKGKKMNNPTLQGIEFTHEERQYMAKHIGGKYPNVMKNSEFAYSKWGPKKGEFGLNSRVSKRHVKYFEED